MGVPTHLNSTTEQTMLTIIGGKTVFFISLYTLMGFVTILCNVIVIVTYWRFSDAQKDVSNTFIVNLSYVDLLVGVINIPALAIVEYNQGLWIFGEISCKIILTVMYVDTYIPVVIMLMLMAHRRISISRNARTRNLLKRKHVHIIMAFTWALLLIFYLLITFGFPMISRPSYVDYDLFCEMEVVYHKSFAFALNIFEFILPVLCLFTMAVSLVYTLWKQSRIVVGVTDRPQTVESQLNTLKTAEKRHRDTAFGLVSGASSSREGGTVSDNTQCSKAQAGTSSDPRSLQSSRTQNSTSRRTTDDKSNMIMCCPRRFRGLRRSTRVLSVIILCHFVFWSPHAITTTMRALCPTCISVATYRYATISLGLNSMVNPFLYAFSSRHYRMGMIRLLQRQYQRD